jgi:hypothetical protein
VNSEQQRRLPFFSSLRDRPRLPVDLVKLLPRCEDDNHLADGGCCYYRVLLAGQYSEALVLREVENLRELQARMTPPKAKKPMVDIEDQKEEGAIASWLRRRGRTDIGQETLVSEETRELQPEPDGMYLVVGGERIRIDG